MLSHAALKWVPPPRKLRRLHWSTKREEKTEGSDQSEGPEVVLLPIVSGLMHRAKPSLRSGNCAVTSTQSGRLASIVGHLLWPRRDTA